MRINLNEILSLLLCSIFISTIGYIVYAYETGQFEKHKSSWVYSVDSNKQGTVISASDNELLLWDKQKCTDRLVGHSDAIKTVAFSHGGQQFASGSIDKSIKVWSLTDKKIIQTLNGHVKGVNKVEFSALDNYLVSAGYDDKLFIWDWRSEKIVKEINIKHTNFSINNQDVLAYIDTSCSLILYDLKSLSAIKVVGPFCGAPAFIPQKNVIAINELFKTTFKFIDLNSDKVLSTLDMGLGRSFGEMKFIFTPDGQYLVAGASGGEIEIWDWQQEKFIRTFRAPNYSSVANFSFNKDNELISAFNDGSLSFWNWNTGTLELEVGNGSFQAMLIRILFISILLNVVFGFLTWAFNAKNRLSSYMLLSTLVFWSIGFGAILYFLKPTLTKGIIWTTTIFSGLFFLSGWFSWLTFFTIPVSLIFCHIKIISNKEEQEVFLPIVINLIFCGILYALTTLE